MDIFHHLLDFILHIDKHLEEIVGTYHNQTYLFLALIVFCETGLVVTPFLPGDSLLFAAGALAGIGLLNIYLLMLIFFLAAFAGDNTNYFIGKLIGHRLLSMRRPLIRKKYLDQTHAFYEKHGGKTVIVARFVPIVRTFAPFVAGLGSMRYGRFIRFSIAGTLLWITLFCSAGYLFGNIDFIKQHFSAVVLAIIFISLLPMIIGILKSRSEKSKQ